MHRHLPPLAALALLLACSTEPTDTGDTGADTADTGADSADTGTDSGDSADTGIDTGDTGDTDTALLTCEERACGGDPVGTWLVQYECSHLDELAWAACPSATFELISDEVAGTLVLNADGTGSVAGLDRSIDVNVGVPTECLDGMSCAEAGAALETTCTDAGGGACDCLLAIDDPGAAHTLTWVQNGHRLILTDEDGDSSDLEFCVADGTLELLDHQDRGVPMSTTLVLTGG